MTNDQYQKLKKWVAGIDSGCSYCVGRMSVGLKLIFPERDWPGISEVSQKMIDLYEDDFYYEMKKDS